MNAEELRKKSSEDLSKHLLGLQQEQFKLRMNKATGQLSNTHRLLEVRREIARTRTLMAQKGE
jgi:large subunit ribosomal protein L29